MSRKKGLSFALLCGGLILFGVSAWRDYSRRALERAVDSATRTDDVATLIRALESNDAELRRKAAHRVARIGAEAKAALPALIESLSTEDASYTFSTHGAIVRAIGSIGPDAKPAVPHLVNLLNQPDTTGSRTFRDSATVKALGQIGPAAADAIPVLLKHLKEQNVIDRKATIEALAKIGPNSPDVVAALIEIFENETFGTKPVVDALAQMGPSATEAVNAYIDKLFDRVASGDGLFRLKAAGGATVFLPFETQSKLESLGALAAPRLRTGLNDDRKNVRILSAEILAKQENSDD